MLSKSFINTKSSDLNFHFQVQETQDMGLINSKKGKIVQGLGTVLKQELET